jgi:hypothetical protein
MEWILRFAPSATMFATIVLIVCVPFTTTGTISVRMALVAISGFALTIALIVTSLLYNRRLRRNLLASDNCLCLHCRYSLLTLPPQGRCPECGQPYTRDETAAAWGTFWLW